MVVFVMLCISLGPFLFHNHRDEEEGVSCFALIVFSVSCSVSILWLYLTMP